MKSKAPIFIAVAALLTLGGFAGFRLWKRAQAPAVTLTRRVVPPVTSSPSPTPLPAAPPPAVAQAEPTKKTAAPVATTAPAVKPTEPSAPAKPVEKSAPAAVAAAATAPDMAGQLREELKDLRELMRDQSTKSTAVIEQQKKEIADLKARLASSPRNTGDEAKLRSQIETLLSEKTQLESQLAAASNGSSVPVQSLEAVKKRTFTLSP